MPPGENDSGFASGDMEIPGGFAAVPISSSELSARLRLCVLVRLDPAPSKFIVVRDTVDAQALLGCVLDGAGKVQRWLEVWIQTIAVSSTIPGVVLETLSNAGIDDRWMKAIGTMQSANPPSIVRTGWETASPRPTWIDVTARVPFHPVDAAAHEAWMPCRDEAVLSGAGLPAYGSSLHRYLYLPKLSAQSPLIPLTANAPTNERTRTLESVMQGKANLLPLNVGGFIFIRAFDAMSIENLFDLLSGRKAQSNPDDNLPQNLRVQTDSLLDPLGLDGWVFVGHHGKWGRLLEAFHLKLRLLAGAVSLARLAVEQTHRPMLNLSAESFRVSLADAAPGLPRLWSARVVLGDSGDALEVPVFGSDERYYIPRPRSGSAIYRPGRTGEPARGSATVRIRKTSMELADGIVVEGTLTTQERIEAAASDLAWIRIKFDEGSIDLYARLDTDGGLAAGEWRFRSVGQRLDKASTDRLRANEGRPTPAGFEILSVLSSPTDLYALAVLTVRALLVNGSASLPVALDEAMSLAKQIANKHDGSSPLKLRVRAIFESDPRWLASLGPQRLSWEPLPPEQAMDLIPIDLWMDTLAMLVAMFPGIGPDSTAADFGAAPQSSLQRVFDRALADLNNLLVKTRSLIVIDWRYNREIHSVVRSFQAGLTPQQTPAPAASATSSRKTAFSDARVG